MDQAGLNAPPNPAHPLHDNGVETAGPGHHAINIRTISHHSGLVWLSLFVVVALMLVQLPPMVARQDSVMHAYSALVEADALARQRYVEPLDSHRLVDGAIRGMLLELDPYSGYISPDALPGFARRHHGESSGVGLEIGVRGGQLTIIAPIEGGPAARAGIRPGDILVSVEGRDVRDCSVFDVEEMLAGPPGTTVDLIVQHPYAPSPKPIRVLREPGTVASVRGFRRAADGRWGYMLDPQRRIGYIRVSSFHDHTMAQFDEAIAELHRAAASALILDLRFNPGGLMDQAVAMVDRFVNAGVIVSTVNRRRAVDEYRAKPQRTTWDGPLVVLINGSSASSAEIVAGSLQSHGRAVVVGERSFGKGSVQHLLRLTGHKAAIKLTVAHYRLPDGRIIHRTDENADSPAWGVLPDVPVALTETEARQLEESRNRLDAWPSQSGAPSGLPPRSIAERSSAPYDLALDRQLAAAVEQVERQLSTMSGPP